MKHLICLVVLLQSFLILKAQKITTDTLFIDYYPDTIIPINFKISNVYDIRNQDSKHLGYQQKKKYFLIPIDKVILTKGDFASLIQDNFQSGNPKHDYNLTIEYFYIDKYKGKFINPYVLSANIIVEKSRDDSISKLGTLIYDYEYKPFIRRTSKQEVYETMLNHWNRDLKLDLIEITNHYINTDNNLPPRLIQKPLKRKNFVNASVACVVGNKFWQTEGEFYFTRPETDQRQWFYAGILRYQNNSQFEAILFGSKSEHYHKGLNEKWGIDITSSILFGLNKWKNNEETLLWEIFQLSGSSSQTINYEKKNEPGFFLKFGGFENCSYIYDRKLILQAGIYLGIGYKF